MKIIIPADTDEKQTTMTLSDEGYAIPGFVDVDDTTVHLKDLKHAVDALWNRYQEEEK